MTKASSGITPTFWLTGLPCSGKTTVAQALADRLDGAGIENQILDGDMLRTTICSGLGFSKEDRVVNIKRVAYIAQLLGSHRIVSIVSLVSPYADARRRAREIIGKGFTEVFCDCPLEDCINRDVKGMYAKALRNEIADFTGVSDPYERPESPEFRFDTSRVEPDAVAGVLVDYLVSEFGGRRSD